MSVEHFWRTYQGKDWGDREDNAWRREFPWNRPWPLVDRQLCAIGWHRSSISACLMGVPYCRCHRCGRPC